jgi:hypothetical protein
MNVKELRSPVVFSFIRILLQQNSNLGFLYCRSFLNLCKVSPKDQLDGGSDHRKPLQLLLCTLEPQGFPMSVLRLNGRTT